MDSGNLNPSSTEREYERKRNKKKYRWIVGQSSLSVKDSLVFLFYRFSMLCSLFMEVLVFHVF